MTENIFSSTEKQKEEQKIKSEAIKHYTFFINYFNQHIPSDADLNYIFLKTHLLIEYYLNHLLILKLGSFKLDEIENLKFSEKLKKLKTFQVDGLEGWVISSLFKLNRIRNNLSHSIEYNVSEADVDSLGFYFGKDYIYKKFSEEGGNLKNNSRWILMMIGGYFYIPIVAEIIMEGLKRKNNQAPPLV